MLQDEHIIFECNKVQVLIVNFVDVCDTAGSQCRSCQVLQLLPWDRRDEIEVINIVKAVLEVLRNSAEIFFCWRTKVNCWNVGNAVAVWVELTEMIFLLKSLFITVNVMKLHVKSATQVTKFLNWKQWTYYILTNTIIDEKFPHRFSCESLSKRLI